MTYLAGRTELPDASAGRRPAVSARLLPGTWVEVRPLSEIAATLDETQALDGLPFMPEMARFCGGRYRVLLRAERTCVHPPEFPLRQLRDSVTLVGLRCDGREHGGCQLGCMLFWKEAWLRPAGRGDSEATPDAPEPGMPLRATHVGEPDRYMCQATELRRATDPGVAIWRPGQYLRLVRVRTFTISELLVTIARLGGRRIRGLFRAVLRPTVPQMTAAEDGPRLQPGEWVEVRTADGIRRTLDAKGTHRGLAIGNEMYAQCGRRAKVLCRVDRIIDESTGRLRTVQGTVILEDSVCDRYFGCARGMPFLWREPWLERLESAPTGASPASGGPSDGR